MRALAAIALAACSQPAPAPKQPIVSGPPGDAALADVRSVSQDEKLAAIQKAMNELDEGAQGCWAVAATERFDIEGELSLMVEIEATTAKATVVTDTVRNAKLAACVSQLLGAYHWAPPLYGETIQLPFKFRAPDGQSVIDRRLVEWHGQQNVSISVLLDENNTGNGEASMLEVAIAPRAGTGMHLSDRAELWYFLGEAEIKGKASNSGGIAKAGSMMYVPPATFREVIARYPDMHAVVFFAPGGPEGTARAGALPTTIKPAMGSQALQMYAAGKKFGPATIFLDASVNASAPLAASILELGANAKVPEHVHAKETELLYILEGSGTMTINGQDVAVTPTSVIQIPPNTKHAFAAMSAVRAVQVYTPGGPEQRFKKP